MRRAAKTDRNHAEIRDALREAGCGIVDLSAVGSGVPDLLVHAPAFPFTTYLLEVKDSRKPPSERKLTPAQQEFHGRWRGPVRVVTTVEEALKAVGL